MKVTVTFARLFCLATALSVSMQACGATEDIEFVAEHLSEVPMDNRYATLPLWGSQPGEDSATIELQGALSSLSSGNLEVAGPMFSLGLHRDFGSGWSITAFVFDDPLHLSASHEHRPLQTLFAPSNPIVRPADARFTNLDGALNDSGVGINVGQQRHGKLFGEYAWVAGLMWQRLTLQDFRLDYEVIAGPSAGTTGQFDFDNTYAHVVPFVGVQWPRQKGDWLWDPHVLFAMPLPRRGVVGHITGPGFDIHGDTQDVGAGKHFGDPSLTLGLTMTYAPAHLSVDLGHSSRRRWLSRGFIGASSETMCCR